MTSYHLNKARLQAHRFANPQTALGNTPKTGTFTGYWNKSGRCWHGRFDQGNKVGLWTYFHPTTQEPENEFYCNL